MTRGLWAFVIVLAHPALAEPGTVLRMATVAPDGTAWAREMKAFARDVERDTHGEVQVKWYFGGIAGDETQVESRIRRNQLDGIGSGGMLCERTAPSLRVMRVPGLFQTRDESNYVLAQLSSVVDEEVQKSGFVNLGEMGLGSDVLLTRAPITSMADLRRTRFWIWDLDEVFRSEMPALGLHVVPLPVEQARRAYQEARVDGFIALPTAALAFQWSAEARYIMDLHVGLIPACILVVNRAFDQLHLPAQQALRAATAKLRVRLGDLEQIQDEALIGGLFAHQGLRTIPVSATLRTEFLDAARAARDRLDEKLVPRALLLRVLGILADFRAEHQSAPARR